MVKKRIIGVITVKNGLAVQSFGYSDYLPIGKPECLIQNLDRWGADEILIQVIDRSINNLGPDFDLLNNIGKLKISTPIIYCGGIRNYSDSIEVIKHGADRIVLDYLFRKNKEEVNKISKNLGSQAIIASIPIIKKNNEILFYNYDSKENQKMESDFIKTITDKNLISEILLINKESEGYSNSFNSELISLFPKTNLSLIPFGGISESDQIKKILSFENVSAVGIGNFLNYKEHAVQSIKESINSNYLRKPTFSSTI